MKRIAVLTGIMVFVSLLIINCDKKEETVNKIETSPEEVYGTWSFTSPYLPDSGKLSLIMTDEEKFSILLSQANNKTLFKTDGSWSYTDDSVTLVGEDCQYYDTTNSQLVPVDEATCKTPLVLGYPDTDTTWEIRTSNFKVALQSLPIPEETLTIVMSALQLVTLKKEE